MISINEGTSPARIAADTAAPALSVSANAATMVHGANGLGRSARVASVMMPRVPSEPTISVGRSYPATPFTVRRPVRNTSPEASTTSRPSTASVVTPYFTQQSPPAFVDRLPPSVHQSYDDGSGA